MYFFFLGVPSKSLIVPSTPSLSSSSSCAHVVLLACPFPHHQFLLVLPSSRSSLSLAPPFLLCERSSGTEVPQSLSTVGIPLSAQARETSRKSSGAMIPFNCSPRRVLPAPTRKALLSAQCSMLHHKRLFLCPTCEQSREKALGNFTIQI